MACRNNLTLAFDLSWVENIKSENRALAYHKNHPVIHVPITIPFIGVDFRSLKLEPAGHTKEVVAEKTVEKQLPYFKPLFSTGRNPTLRKRALTDSEKTVLKSGLSCDEMGRYLFLQMRKDLSPQEKYRVPPTTNATYGWKWR